MILIGYDGSADAHAAIERASRLFSGSGAIVATVWEPVMEMVTRSGGGIGLTAVPDDFTQLDAQAESSARSSAEEGATRARELGLDAEGRALRRVTSVAAALIDEAQASSADAVIVGTRGRGTVKSALLGSVSNELVHHAGLPVMVVPSTSGDG
jgi:nucleotide-binding universal stress UspA family protein